MSNSSLHIKLGQSFAVPLRMNADAYPLQMIWVKAGAFQMGSPSTEPNRVAEDEERFMSTISQGFWLAKNPITRSQWKTIYDSDLEIDDQNKNYPIVNINWYEAMAFSWEMNRILDHLLGVKIPAKYRFSLPIETTWEYACRSGTQAMYHWGNSIDRLDDYVWYRENSLDKLHKVGQKAPNQWGFYDMLGHVGEWCCDAPSDYPSGPTVDWVGQEEGIVRTVRGGDFMSLRSDNRLRCAGRDWLDPVQKYDLVGFRVSLLPRSWGSKALSNL